MFSQTKFLSLAVAVALASALGCGDNVSEPAVAGVVFEDVDADGVFDEGELPLANVTVYIDVDDNGRLDPWDVSAVTDPSGAYRIEAPFAGDVAVRQHVPFGMESISGGAAARLVEHSNQSRKPDGEVFHIIGGNDASELEYPFMAALGFGFEGQFFQFCGAALIAPRFLVTAAHCAEGADPAEVLVLLGTNDLESGTPREVRGLTLHPDFDGDVTVGNDIAVVELAEAVDFAIDSGVHTIELAEQATVGLASPDSLATALGWGVSDNSSALLQEVHIPIAADADCGTAYPEVATFNSQICAGAPEGGIDSCSGDSGGPLVVRDPERDVWVHAGVTSWGDGCAVAGKPGVYARTSALAAWVKSEASAPSRVHRLTVSGEEVRADFGNQLILRPQVQATDPRVQLTSLALTSGTAGTVPADTQADFEFRVLSDGEPNELVCSLDPDGPGPVALAPVSCDVGQNQISHPGYTDGAYRADLLVELEGQTQVRSTFVIAGSPRTDTVAGALAIGDPFDPDFNNNYFIDHYELTATVENVLTIVELDVQFDAYVALYDADVRDNTGGGTLDTLSISGGKGTLRFFTQPGRRYLLGVSTLGERETGSYGVDLINNGTLTPVSL